MDFKGQDFLYIGLGAGALYLILKNAKPLSDSVIQPLGQTIQATTSVVNPLLSAAGKGAQIVTNPETWKLENNSYTYGLLKAPFSTEQAWRLFKLQPGLPEFINASLTSVGLFK